MSLEEEKLQENEGVRGLLNEEHKVELGEILAFGEKYKKEGEEMKKEFWNEYPMIVFGNLILQYEDSKRRFEKQLLPEERKMLYSLNDIMIDKFYKEYLFDRIVYSGDKDERMKHSEKKFYGENLDDFREWVNGNKDDLKRGANVFLGDYGLGDEGVKILAEGWKNSLQPGIIIDLQKNGIGDEGAKILAKEWKNSLQPGMRIILWHNEIGDEGAKILAREWKDSLQPGMRISLQDNEIGDKGAQAIAKQWNDKLQLGMEIDLSNNGIGMEGIKVLAEEWKDKLQPGMEIDLSGNKIGDKGTKILAEEWKDSLQQGMTIGLDENSIGDEGLQAIMDNLELKEGVTIRLGEDNIRSKEMLDRLNKWIQGYNDRGINCEVLV